MTSVRQGARSQSNCSAHVFELAMRLRASWLFLFLAVPGCQCFQPVGELEQDAGVDAGRSAFDAGSSTDGGEECLIAADCRAAPWAACLFAQTPALSCVDHRCVSECRGGDAGRTCDYQPGTECMTCGAEIPLCNADTCATNAFSATVSVVGCRPGVTPPFANGTTLSFVPLHDASCEMSVTTDTAGLGQVVRSQDVRHSWFIRELGGWCVGEQLPTGAIRSYVACPACTFGIEGF